MAGAAGSRNCVDQLADVFGPAALPADQVDRLQAGEPDGELHFVDEDRHEAVAAAFGFFDPQVLSTDVGPEDDDRACAIQLRLHNLPPVLSGGDLASRKTDQPQLSRTPAIAGRGAILLA